MDLASRFERIFIHLESWETPVAQRIRSLSPSGLIEKVTAQPLKERMGSLAAQEFSASKRLLYVAPYKGQFFKRCPGSRPGLLCCNYFVLNLGLQCDMNCSYCYLQSYINTPTLTIYSNLDQAIQELKDLSQAMGEQGVRIGTGEVIDSLSLDDVTLYSRELIAAFRGFPRWTLEFKTKSAKVEQFLEADHAGNVVVSWSINPQFIIDSEEHGTASLEQRLAAARLCRDRGFQVAFHLDPVIWHPDWEAAYGDLVDQIARSFSPQEIPYLSLGALRFQPEQRHLMRERFGMKSWVNRAEVLPSQDGKLRYDRRLRSRMFDFIQRRFQAHDLNWRIFLCMETPETWLATKEQIPHRQNHLKDLFDSRVVHQHRHWRQNQTAALHNPD